jgi:hypothetical protein
MTKPNKADALAAFQNVAEAVEELLAECYRLRAELKTALAERDEANGKITRMRDGYEGCCPLCETVGLINVKLLAERDEARREICVLQVLYSGFYHVDEEKECAKDLEWDCFPD